MWDSGLRQVPESYYFPRGKPQAIPEVYTLWKRVKEHGAWVEGGYSKQPHLLMMEFEVCRNAERHFLTVELPALEKQHHEH